MEFIRESEEVLYTSEPLTLLYAEDVDYLREQAYKTKRKRIRLCTHPSVDDSLHEMVIVHTQGAYVRPHRHPGKSESFHMIEGKLDLVVFDDDGAIRQVIPMGLERECAFYYRLQACLYHTVVPTTPTVVFHEVTNGPFRREETEFAPWSPAEDSSSEVRAYQSRLRESVLSSKISRSTN